MSTLSIWAGGRPPPLSPQSGCTSRRWPRRRKRPPLVRQSTVAGGLQSVSRATAAG